MPISISEAIKILDGNVSNINLSRHCYAVGKSLVGYFDYYEASNIPTGSLSRDQWEIIGILHDSDWEFTKDTPENHTIILLEWLKDYDDIPEEMINVFKSHNTKTTHLREPATLLEWTLECCDELTGFIVAITLILPSKSISDVTVDRVLKKFKQKEFARAVDREQIADCENKLNIPLHTFVEICLNSMKSNAELLGL